MRLSRARRLVPIGVVASGPDLAGTALAAVAAQPWERLQRPVRIDWFPAGRTPRVLVRPAPGTAISPSASLVLTFNRPVAGALGAARPRLRPRVRGSWREPNDHTLVFAPSGLGFPLGTAVHLRLPRSLQVISGADPVTSRTIGWHVPPGSTVRLEQLLAGLGYLPLAWKPARGEGPATPAAQAAAAADPPAGTFSWRYGKTPAALRRLWSSAAGRPTVISGAIMAFDSTHGLPLYHYATHALWRALLHDAVSGRKAPTGYSYVYVSETLPETLTLWHDGRVILRTAVNTGIPASPTNIGTFPVYLHLTSTTMSGTNPDGTHYNDPGVPWVNYFSGGDAVHGFVRPGYGYPQSLGCVEAPISTAARIFPYVQVGTLVTVTPPA